MRPDCIYLSRCKHIYTGVQMEIILLRMYFKILQPFNNRRGISLFKVNLIFPFKGSVRAWIISFYLFHILWVQIRQMMIPYIAGMHHPLTSGHKLIFNVPTESIAHSSMTSCKTHTGGNGIGQPKAPAVSHMALCPERNNQIHRS